MNRTSSHNNETLIGLDVGEKRIGVARVNTVAKLPSPIGVIKNTDTTFEEIKKIANEEGAATIVVGIPRNLDGLETAQSVSIRKFAKQLEEETGLNIVFADESLSSKRAEKVIRDQKNNKTELDALAACFILEEFINGV